jgi:hypothetical protein
MILLLIFMAVVIAVPATVEAIRSPEDNLVRNTERQLDESIVKPLQHSIQAKTEEFSGQYLKAIAAAFLEFVKFLVARVLLAFKDVLKS